MTCCTPLLSSHSYVILWVRVVHCWHSGDSCRAFSAWVLAFSLRGSPRCALIFTMKVRAPLRTRSLKHSMIVAIISAFASPASVVRGPPVCARACGYWNIRILWNAITSAHTTIFRCEPTRKTDLTLRDDIALRERRRRGRVLHITDRLVYACHPVCARVCGYWNIRIHVHGIILSSHDDLPMRTNAKN